MKTVIQRNLPLNKRYIFVSAKYVSLIDGTGSTCENCGKLIANMITVKDEDGKQYVIGQDCAKTLTSLQKDVNYILSGNAGFEEGKRIRAKFQNHIKKGSISGAYFWTAKDGNFYIIWMIARGGTAMDRINHREITTAYLKDLNILPCKPSL